jgi:hypothetical protein
MYARPLFVVVGILGAVLPRFWALSPRFWVFGAFGLLGIIRACGYTLAHE